MADNITEIAGDLARHELGIRDDSRPVEQQLTPVSESLPDSMFKRGEALSWLTRRKEAEKPLDPRQLTLAKLSVVAYGQHQAEMRTRFSDSEEWRDYGKATKVVGEVSVSPAGPEGRYIVNFTTTNSRGESDWRATASTFIFDVQPSDLDSTYGAREDNWLVGEKDGQSQIVGRYKELFDENGGKVAEALKTQGWQNIGEVRAADIDRHAGFLTPPSPTK